MIGTQIGDLELIRLLAEGGMGKVYLARHSLLNELQAVKVLDPLFTQNPQIVTRFLNEGRATVKLKHPHLVTIHNVGRLPDGAWYMVMEYLEGGTLGGLIRSYGGPMSVYFILEIMTHVLCCTQHLHLHNVVHRDLKPENLYLIERPDDPHFVKVLDLGIALIDETIAIGPGTHVGTVMGTPSYMAPEQLRGEKVDARADIFAIGVIIYEMLTGGWFPWQRDDEPRADYIQLSNAELYHRQQSTPAIDPRRRFPGVPEGWARAVLRIVDPDQRKRPENDRALALLLIESTPNDGSHDNAYDIVKQRGGKDLLRGGELTATTRTPLPATPTPDALVLASGTPTASSRAGKTLQYQLGAKLGAGGMAEVYEGRLLGVEGFKRRVAIKRVLSGLSEVPAFVAMFVAEAQIASRLNHTNVVSVFLFDRDDDGRLCLVMEYVHGKDLATLLDAGPIAPSLIIYVIVELLRGLGYAHAPEPDRDGIVHRDVSPQNLLLSYEGAVKVVDFGIAKARSASGNVHSHTVRGKPSYMSPEQCNGDVLDARSDLFAVGTMLYEMLTQRPLFRGTVNEILAHVLHKPIPLPSTVNKKVPRDLEAITMKLMARDRDERYPSAEAAIADLLQCKDAPRDGRGELVHILAQRFPENAMRTRLGGLSKPVSGASAPVEKVTRKLTVTAPPELRVDTAPELSRRSRRRASSRRRRVLLTALVLGTLLGVVGAITRSNLKESSRGTIATSPETGSANTTVDPKARMVADPSPGSTRVSAPTAPTARASAVTADAGIPAAMSPPTGGHAIESPRQVQSTSAGSAAAAEHAGSSAIAPAPAADAVRPAPSTALRPQSPSTKAVVAPEHAGSAAIPSVVSAADRPHLVQPDQAASQPRTAIVSGGGRTGTLSISVKPWAMIWINGKSMGETPYREPHPVGRYRVRITNTDMNKDETTIVTINADQTTTLERKW